MVISNSWTIFQKNGATFKVSPIFPRCSACALTLKSTFQLQKIFQTFSFRSAKGSDGFGQRFRDTLMSNSKKECGWNLSWKHQIQQCSAILSKMCDLFENTTFMETPWNTFVFECTMFKHTQARNAKSLKATSFLNLKQLGIKSTSLNLAVRARSCLNLSTWNTQNV